ncbi:MAG: DUF5777 family beta-barrel protein [Balneolaceae bacterium]|nr:DUF5777 family beta-barrel protein [Balneolaceae bacterium]
MERERVNPDGPVEATFWGSQIVGLGTVETLPAQNLNATIFHSFGILTNNTLQNFFGLDIAPNVRLGLDYGITDYWTIGIGRTTLDKVVDIRTKLSLIRQTKTNSTPLSIGIKGDVGLSTEENQRPIADDLNFFISLPIAKKFSNKVSLQIAPMYSHFNSVNTVIGLKKNHFAVALAGEWHISDRYALNAEYYPVFGSRSNGTTNALALGLNIDTGGHVFQIFLASSNGTTEQYIISQNTNNFFDGDFRIGFNINRVFRLGK